MRPRHIGFLFLTLGAASCGGDRAADESSVQGKVGGGEVAQASPEQAARDGYAIGAPAAAPPPPPTAARSRAEPGPSGSEELPTGGQAIVPTMVIRTGDARIEVRSVDTAIVRLQELAQRLGGFVANSSMQSGEREIRSAMLELKIPADRFAEAQAGLTSLGKVEYVNVNAQDVSEEFVDITARMDNSRRLEDRLVALLATRTGRLEDVLAVERELARVRETIERYEGRLRYLRTRAQVSTLTVTVHEGEPLVGQLGTGNRIVEAFRNAWRNFVGFVAFLIETLGVALPLGVIAFIIFRYAWKRRPPRSPGGAPGS